MRNGAYIRAISSQKLAHGLSPARQFEGAGLSIHLGHEALLPPPGLGENFRLWQ